MTCSASRNMRDLLGNAGIGHVRYRRRQRGDEHEAQLFYVNSPFGISLVHNGNLTNGEQLKADLFKLDARHINTNSDSEVLLNVLALARAAAQGGGRTLTPEMIFKAVAGVHQRCKGYAVTAMIAELRHAGLRDPPASADGLWPQQKRWPGRVRRGQRDGGARRAGLSSSCATSRQAALFIDFAGHVHAQCAQNELEPPASFGYISTLARPDSVIDGISVYDARVHLVPWLANEIP